MPDPVTALRILREGEIEIVGRIVGSSNNAMLATVSVPCPDPEPAESIHAVYKPTAGERPLDDFPDGTLSRREVAAWHVSEALGWGIVPPTVLRDGPFGEGMVQQYIELDLTVDVVEMIVSDDPRLRRIAAFDAAVNNTDRKGGHLLPVDGGAHVFGVDHGVCFSPVPKLRTVLWGWRGDPFDDEELAGFDRLCGALAGELGSHPARPADVHRGRSDAATRRRAARDAPLADAVAGLTPIVVPNDRFYRIDTALLTPIVDGATWQLRIHGMVDRETTLTYDELLAMPLFEQYVTIACVSNEVGGNLVGNAKWTGVRLRDVLEIAGVQAGADPARRPVGRRLDRGHADGLGHGPGPRADDRGAHERRAAAAAARLPGPPDRSRACTATCRRPSGWPSSSSRPSRRSTATGCRSAGPRKRPS